MRSTKNTSFIPKKKLRKKIKFIKQPFSADSVVFSKRLKKNDPENKKKTPSKVAHNRPPNLFLSTGPADQTAQEQKSR